MTTSPDQKHERPRSHTDYALSVAGTHTHTVRYTETGQGGLLGIELVAAPSDIRLPPQAALWTPQEMFDHVRAQSIVIATDTGSNDAQALVERVLGSAYVAAWKGRGWVVHLR